MIIVYMAEPTQVNNPVKEPDVKYKDIFLSVDRVETLPSRVVKQTISIESELMGITENDQPVPLELGRDYTRTIKKYKAFPEDLTEVEYIPEDNQYDFIKEGTAYFIYYSLTETMKARTAPDIVANFEKNNRRIIESYTPDEDKRHANPSFLNALIHDYEITTKKKEAIKEDITELFFDFDLINKYFQEVDPNENDNESFTNKMQKLNITQFKQSTLDDNDGDGLWKINANIYKLFDRLVKKVPEIQERMRTKSVDYNLKRWDDFVTEYLKEKNKDSDGDITLYDEKRNFYEKCKENEVTSEQKKELYALKWYTRGEKNEEKFEVKIDIPEVKTTTSDENKSGNISFGDNYKVDDNVVFLKPDGKTYIKEGEEDVRVYWIDAKGNNNKIGSTLGYKKGLTTRIEQDNMYDTFKASGTEDDRHVGIFGVGWGPNLFGSTSAKGKQIDQEKAGGKRITRRKRKQKRRSTRKRR